jgi:hypothetical protein
MELSDATEKTPAIPGIDAGTFRLVVQRLNHYATPGPVYRSILLTMEIFQTKVEEKIKTNILCYNKIFEKCGVYEMWKDVLQLDRAHDNMAHEHCMPDK